MATRKPIKKVEPDGLQLKQFPAELRRDIKIRALQLGLTLHQYAVMVFRADITGGAR